MTETLPFEDLERVFDLVAKSIDDVGEDQERLFLSKLVLALAHRISDFQTIEASVEIAKRDLDNPS